MLPVKTGGVRILDFDIENRPLSYYGDRPTSEITAIAACWVDEPYDVKVWLLGRDDPAAMLAGFVNLYDQADMVSGHYIRRHDLPIICGALMEYGISPLGEKLTEDTKLDLTKRMDQPATQEHLAYLMGMERQKFHMTQASWREANRLTPAGLALIEKRVAEDVRQHMELRVLLRRAGLLKAPKVWRP